MGLTFKSKTANLNLVLGSATEKGCFVGIKNLSTLSFGFVHLLKIRNEHMIAFELETHVTQQGYYLFKNKVLE